MSEEKTEYDNFIGKKESNTISDMFGVDDPHKREWEEHWIGMPEFENEENSPYKTIQMHFRNKEDYEEFQKLIGQELSDATKSAWHPKLVITKNSLLRWIEIEGNE